VFFFAQTNQSSLVVLAGKSGSGKTELLENLNQQDFPVINLEKITQHSGSAFGKLTHNNGTVASVDLDTYLRKKNALHEPVIFTECKAGSLGNIMIPTWFIECMKRGFIIHLDTPFEQRLERLTNRYKNVPVEKFLEALEKLKGKIDGDSYKIAKQAISTNDYKCGIGQLLLYYDNSNAYKYYIDHAAVTINTDGLNAEQIIEQITTAVLGNHPLFFQGS
jgi:tRNA 2-selenouridine synthase